MSLLKRGKQTQETFQDSQLVIKWEIFPLLGKTGDKNRARKIH